jgi:hypothetical protein
MVRRTLAMLVMAVAMAACGDDDSQSPDPIVARYALEIEGALTETAEGASYFGADTDEDGEAVWVLLLGTETSRHLVLAGKAGSSRPAPGTYAVVNPTETSAGWTIVHLVSDGDELLGLFMADRGTITISRSTPDEVTGTLEFEASGAMGEAAAGISVAGTFTAVPAPGSLSSSRIPLGAR